VRCGLADTPFDEFRFLPLKFFLATAEINANAKKGWQTDAISAGLIECQRTFPNPFQEGNRDA